MIFLSTGSHSPYSRFGSVTVQAIARAVHTNVQIAQFVRLEEFYEAYTARKSDVFAAFIHPGDKRIANLLQRTQSRIVLFDDDLGQTIGRLMASTKKGFRKTAIAATTASSTLSYIAETGNCFVYPCPNEESLMLPFVQSLSSFFGVEPDQSVVDEVAVRLKTGPITPRMTIIEAMKSFTSDYEETQSVLSGLTTDERATLDVLRKIYSVERGQGQGGTFSWPVQSLVDASDPLKQLPAQIELLGKARRLIDGPEYRLMPGEWLTETIIDICDNHSLNKMVWRISEGKSVRGTLEIDVPAEGRLALTQTFRIEDPTTPVRFTFDIKEGAIEGLLSIQSIRLRRMRPVDIDLDGA